MTITNDTRVWVCPDADDPPQEYPLLPAPKIAGYLPAKAGRGGKETRRCPLCKSYSAHYEVCDRCHKREKSKIRTMRKRTQKMGLPSVFTTTQWLAALKAFEYKCAICGKPPQPQFNYRLTADHWIPLNDPSPANPGAVSWNMIPVCPKCNTDKDNRDPVAYITRRFLPNRADEIISRITAYLDECKRQEEIAPILYPHRAKKPAAVESKPNRPTLFRRLVAAIRAVLGGKS